MAAMKELWENINYVPQDSLNVGVSPEQNQKKFFRLF